MREVFVYKVTDEQYLKLIRKNFANKLNATEWNEKPPLTCKIELVEEKQSGEILFHVVYRPNGWKVRRLDKDTDGIRLDGKGNPLPKNKEAVILEFNVYEKLDFNNLYFGKFIEKYNV
jgi:hypothetical protein